jgi:hypothetical protein
MMVKACVIIHTQHVKNVGCPHVRKAYPGNARTPLSQMHVYAQSIQVTLPIRRCDHNRAAFPHSVKQRAKDDGITDIRHVELVEAQ